MTKGIWSNMVYLSIVIPALNEEKRIGGTLEELALYIKKNKRLRRVDIEVIVVSANSKDKTHEIIRSKQRLFKRLRIIKPGPVVGKGRDVREGMLKARGRVIIFMDADLATPLKHLDEFITEIENEYDIVIATRNLKKHHKSIIRRSISYIGNILFKFLGGVWVEDSQCGFKMFTKKAAKICFENQKIMGWGFDMEILAIAMANDLKIKQVRVDDWVSVPFGTFEEGFVKSTLRSLVDLLYIFLNRLMGNYRRIN